jgi:hypothetical protein
MGVVDCFVDMEIELDSVQPLEELFVGAIKGWSLVGFKKDMVFAGGGF